MTAAAAARKEVAVLSTRVRTGIVILVSTMWAASTVMTWVDPDFRKDPSLDAAFGLVIGVTVGVGRKDDKSGTDSRKGRR